MSDQSRVDPLLSQETADILAKHRLGRGMALPHYIPLRCSCEQWFESDAGGYTETSWADHLSEVLTEAGIWLTRKAAPIKPGRYQRRERYVVEALRWNSAEAKAIADWAQLTAVCRTSGWALVLPDGTTVEPGDWLIRSADGRFSTTTDPAFYDEYEPVPLEAKGE